MKERKGGRKEEKKNLKGERKRVIRGIGGKLREHYITEGKSFKEEIIIRIKCET